MPVSSTLHPDLAGAVHEVLSRAPQPLNSTKIRSSLVAPFKVAPKLKDAFADLLNAEANAGRIFPWAPATAKSGPRYWTLDAESWARLTLVKAAVQPITPVKLAASVAKQFGKKPAEALIGELCETGELIRIPLFGGGAKGSVCSTVSDPEAFRAQLDAARKIIEAGYRRLGLQQEPAAQLAVALTDRLMNALAELEPQKGLLVTATRLRRALANVSKQDFDSAAIRLQQDRRVILHRHSNPNSLPEEERAALIGDSEGNYFVGACWRVKPEHNA